jgi:PAS domain S-box-containing protein
VYESKFFSFDQIIKNKVTRLLLRSFLPIVIIISIVQGFLDAEFTFNDKNPSLTSAIILFVVVVTTSFIVYRVSALIGNQLLRAEKLLEESEEKFRSILENSSDPVFITNQKGEFLYTNKAVTDLLGYTSDEMKKLSFPIISPRHGQGEYFGIFKRILNRGNAFSEIELLKKDGSFIPADVNTFLLPGGNIFGNCKDITERKLAEKARIESDTKYRLIADYNYDWEFWITNEKKFRYNSPSCEKISGYKPSDFSENPDLFSQIIHPKDLAIYENHIPSFSENVACPGIDYRIFTKSGEIRWINHVCQPVFSESGVNLGRRGSNSDITDRKTADDLIQQLNRRLKKLNTDKDRFISILGHDLKSPFNSLLGFSEILMNEVHKLNINEIGLIAGNINNSARNTYNLLDDLLKWANAQQGKFPFNPQSLSLPVVCWDVLKTLNPLAESKKITINYVRSEELKFVADNDMVKTVLRNLISNSIKFTNIGGEIYINAEKQSGKVIISVRDNGIGISPENLDKLFDISQVLTTKGTLAETGTGLGLLLCREFVENHGGTIWAESVPGEGSIFRFSLPESPGTDKKPMID